jgi:hypothetical protein
MNLDIAVITARPQVVLEQHETREERKARDDEKQLSSEGKRAKHGCKPLRVRSCCAQTRPGYTHEPA